MDSLIGYEKRRSPSDDFTSLVAEETLQPSSDYEVFELWLIDIWVNRYEFFDN